MNRLTILLTLVLIATSAQAQDSGEILDRVLAEVNSEVILQSEFAPRLAPFMPQLKNIRDQKEYDRKLKKLGRQILEQMVNEELMVQAAEEVGLKVDPKAVKAELENTKRQYKLDDAGLVQALAAQGYTLASYRRLLQRQYLRQQAMQFFVGPKVDVSDEDIRARYDELARRTVGVARIRLLQILVAVPQEAEHKAKMEAREKALALIERARKGEKFSDLARAESDDKTSKQGGGDLGWIEKGTMPEEWERVAFGLKKGEVSQPLLGPDGWRVFYVAEQEKASLPPFSEVKDRIKAELTQAELQKAEQEWIKKLRRKAHIAIKV